jgi:hypothetical protein
MSRPQAAAGRRHRLYGETEPRSCILRRMDRIPLRFNDRLVVTVPGDLSRDQLITMAEALR